MTQRQITQREKIESASWCYSQAIMYLHTARTSFPELMVVESAYFDLIDAKQKFLRAVGIE